ncbi:glycosyltransferase [uncultured Clostridium sp.]|uniref:glycosyltransferase n=1 Tax=uncultured Clostridium sp. TaxID=59620 RepID=UPI0025995729|nr:glycosyltransferase [uncultured Clostridium sp.]
MRDLISVIMSCYNEELDWIEQSIESILNQTYKNIEFIIICDNPENYEIKELLLKYKEKDNRIILILNEKNLGLVESLNKGLLKCTGNYIARMDADDISNISRLEKQLKYFKQNTNIDLIMSATNYIDEKGKFIKSSNIIKSDDIKKMLLYGNISTHPTWMFKREILQKVGKYNNVIYVEDYDFLCRTILLGYNVGFINEYLLDYRVRNNGITKSKRAEQEYIYQIVNNNYRRAIKGKKYDLLRDLNNIDNKKMNNYIVSNEKFQEGKNLISNKNYIKGIKILLIETIKSSTKRKQMINYFILKIISIK